MDLYCPIRELLLYGVSCCGKRHFKFFLNKPWFLCVCSTSLLTLYSIDTHFDASTTAFENIVGKGEIAHNKQFLLFPQCFLLNQITVSQLVHIFYILSLFAVKSEEPNIGLSGKGLTHSQATDFRLPNWKSLQTTVSNLMKMADSFSKWVENTVGKGENVKMLIMSNFSFSHSVFKRFVLQAGKNKGLFGKGL